ncbi:MAG: hypothetical protein P4M00_02280 [Azospirillaceae bacterium]|nr:hypothetical protein [Azospirillaceae bacterium]
MITTLRCSLAALLLFASVIDDRAQSVASAPAAEAANTTAGPTQSAVFDLLSQRPGARTGRVSITTESGGLLVSGDVDGPVPRFPTTISEIPNSDHVELWLAVETSWGSPPIGWGNPFEDRTLDSEKDCSSDDGTDDSNAAETCRLWYRAQQRYRAKFDRLLIRQWQLAPRIAIESFAAPAFRALGTNLQQQLQILRPTGLPVLAAVTPASPGAPGYGFTVRIPWSAFPPTGSLSLGRVHLMVEVFSPGSETGQYGPFASTSRHRNYGQADSFPIVTLDPPRQYRITPCDYPLRARNSRDDRDLPAFFLPTADSDVREIFVVENPVIGDRDPGTRNSPVITTTPFAVHVLAPETFACGPSLALRSGDRVLRSDDVLDGDFTVLPLGPRRWLAKFGPTLGDDDDEAHWPCGACSSLDLSMVVFDLDTGPRVVLSETRPLDDTENPTDQHFIFSPDWRRITLVTRPGGEPAGPDDGPDKDHPDRDHPDRDHPDKAAPGIGADAPQPRRQEWCLRDLTGSYQSCADDSARIGGDNPH